MFEGPAHTQIATELVLHESKTMNHCMSSSSLFFEHSHFEVPTYVHGLLKS